MAKSMTLEDAIQYLREQYERALRIGQEYIYDPLPWALYQTYCRVEDPPKGDA